MPNYTITSGTLSNDTYWCGDISITGTITVPTGVNLYIHSGAKIAFLNNSSLKIYGILEIIGPEYPMVEFDFVSSGLSNGIYCYSGSSVNIENAIIKNANYGIRAEYTTPQITNSSFRDCKYGIFLYKTNMVSGDPIIMNNRFENIDNWAIYHNNSSSRIRGNEIKNSYGGVFVTIYHHPT